MHRRIHDAFHARHLVQHCDVPATGKEMFSSFRDDFYLIFFSLLALTLISLSLHPPFNTTSAKIDRL